MATEELRFVPTDKWGNSKGAISIKTMEYALWKARMASTLIEKWGMVVGIPDGEDSGGRAKLRTATPEEVVATACSTAELAVDEFRKRGWTVTLPDDGVEKETGDDE